MPAKTSEFWNLRFRVAVHSGVLHSWIKKFFGIFRKTEIPDLIFIEKPLQIITCVLEQVLEGLYFENNLSRKRFVKFARM